MKTLAVIPARYASTRLPGKPLVSICGVPLVVRVLLQMQACPSVDRVLVATDTEAIREAVETAGGEAVMTPADLATGGDRVACVAERLEEQYDLILNVQGDDALVASDLVEPLIASFAPQEAPLGVLVREIEQEADREDPNVVKVVFGASMQALYFSRCPIPYPRGTGVAWYKHMGPYIFRPWFLRRFTALPATPLERAESLEQLRVLEHGYGIHCTRAPRDSISVDTAEDVAACEAYIERNGDPLAGREA
ncbi:MAG: 3-deoxy-manno-octulosonate cytidylyltransferase [Synergistales bacterium]|nr:3-deoxy-manno-octulosonate cytidylyltransferase [Synergistales bacterium]